MAQKGCNPPPTGKRPAPPEANDPTQGVRQQLQKALNEFLPPATPEEDSRLLRELLRLIQRKDRRIAALESTLREIESEVLGVRGDVIRLMEEVAEHRNAAEDRAKLVAYYNRTPAETAIHAMQQLVALKSKQAEA